MDNKLNNFILGVNKNFIHEKVVLAPCWTPESVGISSTCISNGACQIWDCTVNGINFTYIVTGVGAGRCLDIVIALRETSCKSVLFIGSAGALKEGIEIGDIAFPNEVLSAEGASRYLNKNIEKDLFLEKFFVDVPLFNRLINCLNDNEKNNQRNVYIGRSISVESIAAQYKHIESFRAKNCMFIDMESSAFLAASKYTNIKAAIAYCISDNIAQGEPLYLVSSEKTEYRKQIRKTVFPKIINSFVKGD